MKKHHIYSLISSIISLVVTCGLLIVCLFAWYVSNKNVSANGIVASSADSDFNFSLEMYKDTGYSEVNTDKIDLGNLNPGDLFYFRIKVSKKNKELTDDLKFNIKFSGVESKIDDEKLCVNDSFVSYKYDTNKYVNLYEIEENKVVTDSTENNVLYNIDEENKISLANYKIQDVFVVYSDMKNTDTIDSVSNKKLNEESEISLVDDFYCYFALEFNEDLSLVTIDGVESSNAYMFQNLIIKYIDIKEANTNE